MRIELITTGEDDLVIQLHGDFDAAGSAAIRAELEDIAAQAQPQHVFLDIQNVSFIDSSGVGAIVFLYKRLQEKTRQMRIVGAQGQPRELMELLRIHKAIPMVFPSASETEEARQSCNA
jgi:anti-anti-sigma factor